MNIIEKTKEISSISSAIKGILCNKGFKGNFNVYVDSNFFKDSYEVGEEPVDIYVVYYLEKPSDEVVDIFDSMYTYYSIRVIDRVKFNNNYKENCTLV